MHARVVLVVDHREVTVSAWPDDAPMIEMERETFLDVLRLLADSVEVIPERSAHEHHIGHVLAESLARSDDDDD